MLLNIWAHVVTCVVNAAAQVHVASGSRVQDRHNSSSNSWVARHAVVTEFNCVPNHKLIFSGGLWCTWHEVTVMVYMA
jgi:hypothetical protein